MRDAIYLVAGRRRTLHRFVRRDGRLLDDGRCNVDDSGYRREYLDLTQATAESKRLCINCFGGYFPRKENPMSDEPQDDLAPDESDESATGLEIEAPPEELEPLPEDNLSEEDADEPEGGESE